MIVRIWEADVAPEHVDEFCALIASVILPKVLTIDGYLSGEALRPLAAEQDEARIVLITHWRDEESLRAHLGPMWRVRPIWDEQELEYVTRPPRVWHFEPVKAP